MVDLEICGLVIANVKSAAYKMVNNPSSEPLSISFVENNPFSSVCCLFLVEPKIGNRYRREMGLFS
jgi:hypothetical protein